MLHDIYFVSMNKITLYLNEVYKEMQKVNWPSRKELGGYTLLTVVASMMIALLIFGADRVIGIVLEWVYGSAG